MESYEYDSFTYSVPAPLSPSGSETAEDRSRCLLWTASAIRDRGGGDGPSWPSRLSALRARFLPASPLASERAALRADEAWRAAWDEALGGTAGGVVARVNSGPSLGSGSGADGGADDDDDDDEESVEGSERIKIVLSDPRVLDRSGRIAAVVPEAEEDGTPPVGDENADDETKSFREGVLRRACYLQFEAHVHLDAAEIDQGENDEEYVDDARNFSLLTEDSALMGEKLEPLKDEESEDAGGSGRSGGDGGGGDDPYPEGPGWHRLTIAVRLPRKRGAVVPDGVAWSHLANPALHISCCRRRRNHHRDPFQSMVSVTPSPDPSGFASPSAAPLSRTLSHLRAEYAYDHLLREIAADYVGPYGTLDPSLLLSTLRMDPVALEDAKSVQLRALGAYHLRFGLTVKLFDDDGRRRGEEEYPVDLAEAFVAGLDDVVADTHHLGEYNAQASSAVAGGRAFIGAAGELVGARGEGDAAALRNARQLDAVRDLYRRAVEAIEWIDEARTGGVSGGGGGRGVVGSESGDGDDTPKAGGSRWWG